MKIGYKILVLVLIVAGFASCNFLDVVPDERTTDTDTYAGRNNGIDYLYSCYAYLPNPANTPGGLDLLTGDEVITAFEHETFAAFPKGNYSASAPVISYWNTFFQGLRQCYMFMERIDKFPDTTIDEKKDYRAQAKFLIAYYHFLLARAYGPILLIKETPSTDILAADYPGREPFDECVNWICDLLDEAAKDLPPKRDIKTQYGLATSVMAKAVKAKMRLYAASPLFNGNSMYADFKDRQGRLLMPAAYDPQKWVKAREAIKEAIDLAETSGHALYANDAYRNGDNSANRFPEVGVVRRMRTLTLDWKGAANPEVLFADTRGEGYYDLQLKSMARTSADNGANGVSLTWAMLNRFYTKNGLPWDEDPAFKSENKLAVVSIDAAHAAYGKEGEKTIAFNLNREPRFYAWVGFQGGYFEILNGDDNAYPIPAYMTERGRVILSFFKNGNQGRKNRTNNYSPAGYLNKKGTDPNMIMKKSGFTRLVYPWPVIRLADLYLAYAEACVETDNLETAKTYLNRVRVRAGIPTVETAWNGIAVLDQAKLRQIVRQERQIEFYLENQNFWDMRRWLLAEKAFGKKAQGLNIEANNIDDFAQLKEIAFERKFESPKNYLLPIPSADINRNPKLVNNPGY